MLDRLYAHPFTRWFLVVIYILLIGSLPCLPRNCAREARSPTAIDAPFVANQSYGSGKGRVQTCSGGFFCSAVWPRLAMIADRSTEDPAALFTIILAISTIGLWLQTKRLAVGAEHQASDIKSQLDVIKDDFVSTHRPWVNFNARMSLKGVVFDRLGMHIYMRFDCANTGSTPAIGVSINADTFQWTPLSVAGQLQRLEAICTSQSLKRLNTMAPAIPRIDHYLDGTTIFPGGRWHFEKEFLIPKRVLDAIKDEPKSIIAAVAGCVDYAFSFGPLEAHQSRFIFYIGKPSEVSSESLTPIVVSEGSVEPKHLRIVRATKMPAFAVT